MSPLRLLLVSGTSVVGQNVLEALQGRRSDIEIAATGSVAFDLALFDFDAAHLVPETAADPQRFEQCLVGLIEQERPHLVIPCRDDDVLLLARLRGRRPDLAATLLCGSPETALAICDKRRSWTFSVEHDLPFVPSANAGSAVDLAAFAREHGFPLVVKPRMGFGSNGVVIVTDQAQLQRAAASAEAVVQPFLGDADAVRTWRTQADAAGIPLFHTFEGVKRAGQALIAPDGSIASLQCTRNVMRHGFSVRVALDEDPEMRDIVSRAAQVFAAEGWRGPFNVQCLPGRDGRLLIHEFNGRFTGATAAQLLLGQDDVGLAIERFVGRTIARSAPPARWPTEVMKLPRAFVADPARLAAISRAGRWAR